jgi:hypothetical protein
MIIFGTRVRHKKIGEGEFFCPKCQSTRRYHHKQAVRAFTLYFIPIFPIQQLGQFVECQTCGTAFEETVRHLRGQPTTTAPRSSGEDIATMMNTITQKLEGGYPIEFMVRDLTAANLDLAVARGAVNGAVGNKRKTCESCGLTYVPAVKNCTECGNPLQ